MGERPLLRCRQGAHPRHRAAPAPPETALARRVRRPGARPRAGLGASARDRGGPRPLDDPLRAAGKRQDDARQDRRQRDGRRVRRALRRLGDRRAGARGDRGCARAARRAGPAHDPVPGRDPPLQQGAAGRAAARGRGGRDHADRRDDREPVLRGQLGAPQPRPAVRAGAALARRSRADRAARRGGARRRAEQRRSRRSSPSGPAETRGTRSRFSSWRRRPPAPKASTWSRAMSRTRRRSDRSSTTRAATATTTRSPPSSSRCAAPTPTRPSTTSPRCSRPARTRASSRAA